MRSRVGAGIVAGSAAGLVTAVGVKEDAWLPSTCEAFPNKQEGEEKWSLQFREMS